MLKLNSLLSIQYLRYDVMNKMYIVISFSASNFNLNDPPQIGAVRIDHLCRTF